MNGYLHFLLFDFQVTSKTVICPFCGIPQTNLKGHAQRKHNLTEVDAKALKSQFGLNSNRGPRKAEDVRKTKYRTYPLRTFLRGLIALSF